MFSPWAFWCQQFPRIKYRYSAIYQVWKMVRFINQVTFFGQGQFLMPTYILVSWFYNMLTLVHTSSKEPFSIKYYQVYSDWSAVMQLHMKQRSIHCMLSHISVFTLIEAICNLWHSSHSVGFYLAGMHPFPSYIDRFSLPSKQKLKNKIKKYSNYLDCKNVFPFQLCKHTHTFRKNFVFTQSTFFFKFIIYKIIVSH